MTTETSPQPPRYADFFDLPPELRNRIYELALIHPYWIRIKHGQTPLTRRALLCVNPQIYHEAGPIYYGANHFTYECMESCLTRKTLASTKNLISWLRRIGCRNRNFVHHVHIFKSSPHYLRSLKAVWRFLKDQNARIMQEGLWLPLTMLKMTCTYENVDLDLDVLEAEAILTEKKTIEEDVDYHAVRNPEIRRWGRCLPGNRGYGLGYEDEDEFKIWCRTCFRHRPCCPAFWCSRHKSERTCDFCGEEDDEMLASGTE